MSIMAGVLSLIRLRVYDRDEMARRLKVTRRQVTSALYNLQYRGDIEVHSVRLGSTATGRKRAIYRPKGEDWSDFAAMPLTVDDGLKGVRSIFDVK